MKTDKTILNRCRGALLGLAVGDALGTTLEFKPPGSFRPIEDIIGGGPFRLPSGAWTDDTSMAFCLAESLIEQRGFDPFDQMRRYLRWYHEGYLSSTGTCFDIGGTTLNALQHFERTGEPYSGSSNPNTAGNGSIMRLTPVPIFFSSAKPLQVIEMCAQSSRTTHGAVNAVDGCRYMGAVILGALLGASKEEILSENFCPASDCFNDEPLAEEIGAVALGSFKNRQPPFIKGSGYVVKSLEAALWAFYNSSSFAEGALKAVNLGDDADTTGAVYGQIAGAYYGEAGIPLEWREKIVMREKILDYAEQLYFTGNPLE